MEMGHVFYLGSKYSAVLNATVQGAQGGSTPQPAEMGCYGIGITRVLAALLETKRDAEGIVWPHVVV
jgi:prolyl-tRNA synthetase